MSGLTEIVKAFCLSLPTLTNQETEHLLKGVHGRGEFGPRLARWLEQSQGVFPETVRVEYPESLNDRGVDVYIEGQSSQVAIGFQIKSDRDIQAEDFLQRLKAQITDARAYPKLELYIIVLACRPDRFMRLQQVLTEELHHWQSGRPQILTLPPGRAASLWQRCDTPLTSSDREVLLRGRTWHRFFADAGVPLREGEFLQGWDKLLPEERFLPPSNLAEIEASLLDSPLTIIAGPPTIGKTFTAVHLLWKHYKAGKPVEWIEPLGIGTSTSIIPPTEPTLGMQERTRQLAQRLGMRPPNPPQNRWEFIAARMRPDSIVLIEDPFGMTDADYSYSLHTYDFFDLNGCIEAICEGGRQANCRLLVTTRHGLLERWLTECRLKGGKHALPAKMNIIQLTPDNYQSYTFKDDPPLVQFAAKLLRASDKVSGGNVQPIAQRIGSRAQTPQEIQFVIGELPLLPTMSDVGQALQHVRLGAVERIQRYCRVSTDAERLFMYMLMTTIEGEEHNDFAAIYTILHKALRLPGSPIADDYAARGTYWPLFYQIEYKKRTKPNILKWGVHLKASHPSIAEAARRELRENGNGFLDRLAIALKRLARQKYSLHLRQMIARHLINEHQHLTEASIQIVAKTLPNLIEPSYTYFRRNLTGEVLNKWESLPENIRTSFFEAVRNGPARLAAEVCEMFTYYPPPAEDLWRFYDLLLAQKPLIGVNEITAIRHPWEYFVDHLDEAPQVLVDFFDHLANDDPSGFSYVLGKLAGSRWDSFRPVWKAAILSDQASISKWKPATAALNQILYGLYSDDSKQCPTPLLEQLSNNLTNPDKSFRALSGSWALVYWERLPEEFHESLRALFRNETEPEVLHEILAQGMGDQGDKHDIELALSAVERSNDVMAAWLLNDFAWKLETFSRKTPRETNSQLSELIEKCKSKAGDYAKAVLLTNVDSSSVVAEPDIVKLAYIWKAVTGLASKKLKTEECAQIIELTERLKGDLTQYAYYILAYQESELPETLQRFIQGIEQNGDDETRETISNARRGDAEGRRPSGGRSIPTFPVYSFGPTLT